MKLKFTKMHGAGNDYIYINTLLYNIDNLEVAARKMSDRHKGIGSDGLVLIGSPSNPAEADFSMRIFNADGSEAMMCGNASRCIGKYLYERGLTDKTEIRLETRSGVKTLWLDRNEKDLNHIDQVTVDMGEPVFEGVGGEDALFVSMGNPHYVVFTDDVMAVDVAGDGSILEYDKRFPERCNIEFAQILSDGGIRTRVWERGSGITLACGTGACATAVASIQTKRVEDHCCRICMDGGDLSVEWCKSDREDRGRRFLANHVYLTGPAEFVFDGEIEI